MIIHTSINNYTCLYEPQPKAHTHTSHTHTHAHTHTHIHTQDGPTGVTLHLDEAARNFLVDTVEGGRAGSPGAQHVRSLIRTQVMGPLAEQLLLSQAHRQQLQGIVRPDGGSAGDPGSWKSGSAESGRCDGVSMPVVRVSYEGPGSSKNNDREDSSTKGKSPLEGGEGKGRLVFQFLPN